MEEMQHPKGCCVELGNWPIEVQLESTNSNGLPVLFQGSYQGLPLNNQLSTVTGAMDKPMVPVVCHQAN